MKANELEHFGVKGMRWGVRRQAKAAQVRKSMSPDARKAGDAFVKLKKTGIHSLNNNELKDLVARLNLEKQYNSLKPTPASKKAGKFVADMLLQAGKAEVSKLVVGHAAKQLPKLLLALK